MAIRHIRSHDKPSVLITGAAGFLGSSLVDFCVAEGWYVFAVVRPGSTSVWAHPSVRVFRADLRQPVETRELMREARPSMVVHLAANSSVARSRAEPRKTVFENVVMQHLVLDAVRMEADGARVVVVGSADEYADPRVSGEPIAENHPLNPTTPYGHSKLLQDLAALQCAHNWGTHVTRVRPFLTMGPRRSDVFVAGSIARQVAEIRIGRRSPIIQLGDQMVRHDFTDVRDVARAIVLVGGGGSTGEAYNIASGETHTVREMANIMLSHVQVDARIESRSDLIRDGETIEVVGDATRLRTQLGWRPHISFARSACDTVDYWMEAASR